MWPLGVGAGISDYQFFLNFSTPDLPDISVRSDTMSSTRFTASYCNDNGEILIYSNGIWVLNSHGDFVENSFGLNPSVPEWQIYNYPGDQSGFFVAHPGNNNLVYLISLDYDLHPAQKWPYQFVGKNLMVATIDLSANNGAGKVIEKNKILLTGTLMTPAACRHANGRDWWIFVSDADENRHYRILLSPSGFSTAQTQYIGTKPNPIPYNGGTKQNRIRGNAFSPSGKYYADINDVLGFSIFRFDRCSGLLSEERRIDYLPSPLQANFFRNDAGMGAVFSPNDSFFYKTTTFNPASLAFSPNGTIPYLIQYDLSAPDLSISPDTINIVDSLQYHFPTNITRDGYYGAELGPDGRIYIVHSGLGYCTVQYPNLRGRACQFIHDKPHFGVVIGSAIPYMPNYRLGPLDGSPCDTLGLNNLPVAEFRIDDSLGLLSRYFYDLSHHEPSNWHWTFGDGTSSNEQYPLHTYTEPGIYQVCLTVSNQNGSDTKCRTLYLGVSGTVSLKAENENFQVFPNPSSGTFTIQTQNQVSDGLAVLSDINGKKLGQWPYNGKQLVVTQPNFAPGVYIMELRGKAGSLGIVKLLINR